MNQTNTTIQFPFDYDQVFILEEWMIRSQLQSRDQEKYSNQPDLEAIEYYNDTIDVLTTESTFIRNGLFENHSVINAFSKATLIEKSKDSYQFLMRCWPPPCVSEDKAAIQAKGAKATLEFTARPILNVDPSRHIKCQLISKTRGTQDKVVVNYVESIQTIQGNSFSILMPKITRIKGVKKAQLIIEVQKFNTWSRYTYDITLVV